MTKDVIVAIKGMQTDMLESDEIELITTGQYHEKSGKLYITYIDTNINEDEETTTTVKIEDNQLSILRFGGMNTHMVFEEGEKHISHYETPYGLFEISTLTKEINVIKEEESMEIKVSYNLDINHMSMGTNTFTISVKNNNGNRLYVSEDNIIDFEKYTQ